MIELSIVKNVGVFKFIDCLPIKYGAYNNLLYELFESIIDKNDK